MPADVIINPTSGEIYWNDNAGSPQSISIRGDAQNKIDIIGYGASFSPGGSGTGTFVIATFNDSIVPGTAAFAPGTTGNELGSSTLRWKPYLTTTTISDSSASLGTNSTTLLTGVLQVNGGIAISGNASIGQSVLFFNKTNPIYFVGISSPASLASTTNYFLPTSYPGSGTSVLQSDTTGNLTWVPLISNSAGSATTAQNVQVQLVGNPNTQHAVLLTPSVSSAGSAVSGNGTLVYNPLTDVLSTPGLAVTSAATAVSYLNAPALITGGLAVGDNITALNKIGVGVSTSAVTRAEVYASGTDVGFRMFETTGALSRFSLSRNGMGTNVPALNFLNSGSFGANGSGIGVLNATSTASIALFASDGTNANVVRFLVLGGATRVTTNEISIGTDTSGTAFTSILRGVNASGTDISTSDFILQAGRSTGTGTNNGIRFQVATPATSTGSALNAATDVVKMNTSQNATSSSTGTMIVYGGVGISGNANIGGSTLQLGVSWINNATNATTSSTAAAIITGGLAVGSNAIIGGSTLQSGVAWINNSTNATSTSSAALYVTGGLALGSNAIIGGSTLQSGVSWINNNTSSSSSVTGAQVITGGLGLGGNAFIGGTVNITNTSRTGYGSSTGGALVVAGSVGIGGSLYLANQLGVGGTLDYNATGNIAYFAADINSYAQVIVHNHNSGNTASSDFIVSNDSATDTTFFGDFGMNSSGWAATTSAYNNPNAVYLVSNSGDLSLGTLTTNTIRFFYNNGVTDIMTLGAIGMTISYGTTSSSTTSGALQVRGGVGITGNAFIGGSTHITGISWINNSTNATSSSNAAKIITGGLAVGSNAIIGGSTLQSGVSWINNSTNATNSSTAALIVTGGLALGSNAIIGGSTLQSGISWINNSTNATNSSTGALIVTGGLALGSNAIIGGSTIQSGVSWINNTTASTSTSTGAMIVGGGVGIGQTLFVGGMIRLGTNTFTKTFSLGDIALDNGSATDTPAITFYWANNSNFGTDVFSDGVGSTRYRVVWNINESGGREVFTVDQNATMRLYNSSGTNYFALKYTGAGTTIYTLPTSTPAGTAVSVLQSTYEGVMSWVPMSSTAVLSAATGAGNTTLYLLFSNITSGSGVALSTNTSVFYNSATTQLTAPYLYSSNSVGSEGGEIVLNKPASGSGLTTTITIDIQADRLRFFETGGANRGFYLDFSTDSVAGVGKNIIGSASFATTASNVQVSLLGNPNTQHSVLLTPTVSSAGSAVSGNGTLVYNPLTDILSTPGLAVTSTTATTSTTSGAAIVSGGIGIVGNAFIGGTINVASPITIPNGGTNASSFGQSAGFIYYDGANIRLAAATGASINFTNGYYQFDNRVYATAFFANNSQIPNGSGGSGRVTYWSGNNTIASNTNFLWDNTNNIVTVVGNFNGIGLTASGIAATSTLSATSTTSAALTVTGGLALGSNAIIGGSTLQSGVAWINNSTNATSSSTGALIVTGGLALGANAFIGGSTHIVGIDWVNNATNATSSSAAALRVTGGLALGTNAIIGGSTLQSGVSWINNSTNATNTATGALIVTGGLALGTNAIIGGSTLQSGVSWINNATNATTSATGALVVSGGLALGTNAIIGGSTVQAGVAWINNSTNATTTSSAALYVTGGLAVGTNAFIGGTFTHTDTTDSLTTNGGSIVTRGGVGIARNAAIGASLLFTNGTNANLVGFRAGVTAANTMYVLPLNYPGSGTSVLTSDTSGTLSWAAAATGSGSPGGNTTEIQFNNGGTFGGATGLTYQSTLYLTSIASTADQRAVTTVGLRLINSSTVSIAGVQVRYSPAIELVGKAVVSPSTEWFNRFVTDAYGTTGSYAAQQQWKYSYDTGTPGYSNPLFVIHSQKGVGIGRSNIIYQSFFVANGSQGSELTYVLPVAYPGTGTSVLSSDTTGNLSWVPMTTGGSGTPGGSTRQVQYNNGGSFGGATGFEYVSAGNAVTVSYFSAAGGGSTVGMVICAVNGTTTRVGIGLTNPAFELEILGEISATNKSFVIDHPTKSGMKLRYGSLEGPENGVYVRGQLVGSNVIVPPDHWLGLVHEDTYTVHLTPIGYHQNLFVEKIEDYKVYVGTASTFDINCFYSVWAERKDIPKLIVEY